MKGLKIHKLSSLVLIIGLPLFSILLLWHLLPVTAAPATPPTLYPAEFGYGFNVASWDVARLQSMGFNWIKVFNAPGSRLPVNVLLRVNANSSHMANLSTFGSDLFALAQSQKEFIDAYEIGNEPNLDASYGWTTAPNAADYATLLCTAYQNIKAADPDAIVVSAGLAPTGRVAGNWEGHPGHNGLYQDDREFLKEFLDAGGGDCLDAVGYHNYGFSADYDIVPDSEGDGWGTPTYCGNGFCFRGVEKIYEIMVAYGLVEKQVWTTEFGWIVQPPDSCLADGSWSGRQWQIVTEAKQADNLAGAFQYARANYPWLGAMFVFNLNFNQADYYAACEQMRFYSVQGRLAETALSALTKDYSLTPPQFSRLAVQPEAWEVALAYGEQPYATSIPLVISNTGTVSFTWLLTAVSDTFITTIPVSSGVLAGNTAVTIPITLSSGILSAGTYTASLQLTANDDTLNAPRSIPLTVTVAPPAHEVTVSPLVWTAVITPGNAPLAATFPLTVTNSGDLPFDWSISIDDGGLSPQVMTLAGTLAAGSETAVPVTLTHPASSAGVYTATLRLMTNPPAAGAPQQVPLTLYVYEELFPAFLPVVLRP